VLALSRPPPEDAPVMAGVMNDPNLFAKGVLLGLGAAVPIGPVNVQIARHALRNGFASAFCLGCGAVTIDILYATVTAVGFERVVHYRILEDLLGIGAAALLTYLGAMCIRAEREAWHNDLIVRGAAPVVRLRAARAYLTGLLMTMLNPMTLAFWFMAVPALAGPSGADRQNLLLICSGVFAGTVSWVVFFAGTLAWAGRFRRNWWLAAADAAGGAALLVFAAAALLSSLRAFL
jgi:L-lysine exporter family protein LysE/ArgO